MLYRMGRHSSPTLNRPSPSRKANNDSEGNSDTMEDATPTSQPGGKDVSGRLQRARLLTQALRPSSIFPSLGSVPPFVFPFSLLGTGMSILCLSHRCTLEAHNLSSFTGPQLVRNFESGKIIAQVSPILNLDEI